MRTPIEFLSADGTLRLHAEACGPRDAPLTILCLHGLTRNGADFGALVTHLSSRYRVITADQRGRGKSDLSAVPKNLSSLWTQLGSIPTLAIRGELSNILSADILATMAARHSNLITESVPNRGHALMLDEPAAVSAIDAFLEGHE